MRAVRKALADDIDLMIDVNARYSWPEAVDLSKRLQEFDTIGLRIRSTSRSRTITTTSASSAPWPHADCLGGNVYSRFDYRNLLERGGVDYLTPTGEVGRVLRVAEDGDIASAHDCIIAPHTLNGLGQVANLHFAAAVPATSGLCRVGSDLAQSAAR